MNAVADCGSAADNSCAWSCWHCDVFRIHLLLGIRQALSHCVRCHCTNNPHAVAHLLYLTKHLPSIPTSCRLANSCQNVCYTTLYYLLARQQLTSSPDAAVSQHTCQTSDQQSRMPCMLHKMHVHPPWLDPATPTDSTFTSSVTILCLKAHKQQDWSTTKLLLSCRSTQDNVTAMGRQGALLAKQPKHCSPCHWDPLC
jgi:hypothetical protein